MYLLGISFKIVTDCRAFALTMNKKDLCVRVARWALLLQKFDYTIKHRPGKAMHHVDALSRNLPEVMSVHEDNSSLTARLSNAQRDDKTLTQIIESVENKNCDDYIIFCGTISCIKAAKVTCFSWQCKSESNANRYYKANT